MFGKKKKQVAKMQPNPNLFKNSKVGRKGYNPLKHKDGRPFSDIEYFELLGKRVEQIDKTNTNPNLPVDYKIYGFDPSAVAIAKQVCQAIEKGRPEDEINSFIAQCIEYDK